MKKAIFILVVMFLVLGFKCSSKSVGSGGGNAGNQWEFVKSVTEHITLPPVRPPQQLTPKDVKVYSAVPLDAHTLDLVDEGITNQLRRSTRPNPNINPPNAYLNWHSFEFPSQYSVVFAAPNRTAESENIKGCRLLCVFSGCAATAIGTNAGIQIINGYPRAPGGLYLVIARQDFDADNPAPANPETCDNLVRNGVDYESEHARLMDEPRVWFYYQGANDWHPIFPEPSSKHPLLPGAMDKYAKRVKGFSPEYKSITLSDAEINKLIEKYGE